MPNLVIRTIEDTDVAFLAILTKDVQQLHHEALPERFKPVPDDLSEFESFFEKRLEVGLGYIAEVDEEAVGFVMFDIRESVDNLFVFPHFYIHIDQMSIKPDFQGRGIGRELMQRCIAFAKKHAVAYITLNVFDFNDNAISFYHAMGFEVRNMTMQFVLDSDA